MKNLLAAGSNPNITAPSDGSTALHYAVKHRHHLTVLELLTNNADMFLRNKFHLSAFHLAVLEGDEQSVRLMLDRFMDIDSSYLMMKTLPLAQSDSHSQNQTAAVYVLSAAGVEALLANLGANPLIVACQVRSPQSWMYKIFLCLTVLCVVVLLFILSLFMCVCM